MSITQDCMILNLQIGIWQGRRLDKEASREVTQRAKAEEDAARVNKHLVPQATLAPINTAAGAVRNHFYAETLPWKDNGDRLLTRRQYLRFIEQHEGLVSKFHAAVGEFLSVTYIRARDQASFRMGELFKPQDYPEPRELRTRFYIQMDIDAVCESSDFRVQLDQKHLDEVKSGMEQAMQSRINTAMAEVWRRLNESLTHFQTKMAGDEIFRDSTVRNVQSLVDAIADLNVVGDPNLERIRQEIRDRLAGFEPQQLREDPAARDLAASEAGRIIEGMSGFMRAFGGGNMGLGLAA